MVTRWTACIGFALVAACGPSRIGGSGSDSEGTGSGSEGESESVDESTDSSESADAGSSTESGTEETGTSSSSEGTTTMGTVAETGPDEGPGTVTSTDSSTSETGGDGCGITDQDGPCRVCAKKACCPEIEACKADMTCVCNYQCVRGGGSVDECAAQCGDSGPWDDLFGCLQVSCADVCKLP